MKVYPTFLGFYLLAVCRLGLSIDTLLLFIARVVSKHARGNPRVRLIVEICARFASFSRFIGDVGTNSFL